MILFIGILIIPLLIGGLAYFISKQICLKELACMAGVQVVVAGISAAVCYHQTLSDEEVRNSQVVSKAQERVSCSHSYRCHCHQSCSGSGKNRSCHEVCSTCYRHPYDYDWAIYSGTGERWEISRLDSQGTREPPRFTSTQMGEPTSETYSYDNYVKAAPDTLFRHQGQVEKYAGKIPEYPINIYDYYRLNRLVLVNGAAVQDPRYWTDDLSRLNADYGAKFQSNVIVVLTRGMPADYYYALEQAWVGGKKNDIVVVANLDDNGKATWVSIMSWEVNEVFKVRLRDAIMELPRVERWGVVEAVKANIQYHKRKPMADFEYLTASIAPSVTQWVVTLIIGALISVLMSIIFHRVECFPGYKPYRY